jgi:hypothetical protein
MKEYRDKAFATHKAKAKAMGKENNLVIPVMRAVGENKAGGVHESSHSGQHRNQSAAPGFKAGGAVNKPKAGALVNRQPKDIMEPPGMSASAQSGIGRLEKAHMPKPPFKAIMGSN